MHHAHFLLNHSSPCKPQTFPYDLSSASPTPNPVRPGGFNPQFFPRLEGIAELFGRPAVTASWLLHILVINLFAGRWCLLEGGRLRRAGG